MSSAASLLQFPIADGVAEETRQTRLARLNRARLEPTTNPALALQEEIALRREEAGFLDQERSAVAERSAAAPRNMPEFMEWFEQLREDGPGQNDPLFVWLAEKATLSQMQWFLAQEVAGEAGFDDLVALTQLKFPVRAKLELAANYWDEMGRGHAGGMHGPMLDQLTADIGVPGRRIPIVWESVALGNLLAGLAANRHFAYQSVGALGVVELTAPGRAEMVNNGLARLGFPAKSRRYYALHAQLDIRHSASWNEEVIAPLVAGNPALATPIAEGALMRLTAGARCFERYRRELCR